MDKLLTISIAAYNVAQYITQALESLIIPQYMDSLEVFIVDDGSTDDTAIKVQPFVDEYPQTFNYIKKKNGGYGSTVNWSIKNANGKYFQLLDGDDYYDTEGLKGLLEILSMCDEDAVVSQAIRVYPNGKKEFIFKSLDNLKNKTILSIEDAPKYADIAVWGYSFKKDILLKGWKDLPEHFLYTDRLFVIQALLNISRILYYTSVVYNYRVGLEEQSTSTNSIRNHYREAMIIDRQCIEIYKDADKNVLGREYIKKRIALYYGSTICMLLCLPLNMKNRNLIINFENEVKATSFDIYNLAAMEIKRVNMLRKSKYLLYFIWPYIDKLRMIFRGNTNQHNLLSDL